MNTALALYAVWLVWLIRRREQLETEERVARALPGGGSALVVLPAGGGLGR
jgi:hypothetical protein